MLNKKILAVAVATVFSTNAFSAVDLNADTGDVVIAAESIDTGDLNGDGLVVLTGTAQNVVADAGFSIANGTSKYVRFDLTNGEFATITSIDDAGANTPVTAVSAGGVGENYAIFEFAADAADVLQTTDMTLIATYAMTNNSTMSTTYKLFETAQQAIDNVSAGLSTSNGVIAKIESAITGTFGAAETVTATVADEFKKFGGAASTTLNNIDVADLDDTTEAYLFPDTATAFDDADLATGAATLTFAGDFSFGEFTFGGSSWGYDVDGVFTATNATENEDGSVEAPYGAGSLEVTTTDVDATVDAANKGSYTVVLDGVAVTAVTPVNAIGSFSEASGTIIYDTTSITVPYLTTYSSYNQRIYIVNSGTQDASYTTSFTSEDGVTATAGAMASGVVPAGEMVSIKATDLVTLTGKTRTSAIIEIEAQDTAITATSQTVNLTNGGTDTVSLYGELNANTN
jgi:hypothetical protein